MIPGPDRKQMHPAPDLPEIRTKLRAALVGIVLIFGTGNAKAQSAVIVGSWRGTSTCVDREHYPACTDEQVIYDVRPHNNARDTVTLRADKIVNGTREFMSENDFIRQPNGAWTADIRTPRFHLKLTLHIADNRMTGTLTDLSSDRRVREMALERTPGP